jgi:hypothetical protein
MRESSLPEAVVEKMRAVLPEKQLAVAVRHYIEGKSKKKIGKELCICTKRVLFLKNKARKTLKATLSIPQYKLLRENRIRVINKRNEEAGKASKGVFSFILTIFKTKELRHV